MENLGLRLLALFDFCFRNNLECGVCWYEKQFIITTTQNGNTISCGQGATLTQALDECAKGFEKVGWN
jgi:hypothetical protein